MELKVALYCRCTLDEEPMFQGTVVRTEDGKVFVNYECLYCSAHVLVEVGVKS